MILNEQLRLDGTIQSVAMSPKGNLAAVVIDHNKLLTFELSAGTLALRATHSFSTDRYQAPWVRGVMFSESRLAFLDERTLILGWSVDRNTLNREIPSGDRYRTTLLAVDIDSGEVRGEYETYGTCQGGDPLPIDSQHVLFGLHRKTLVCVNIATGREVSRVRELDEALDPIGDESECPEEGLTNNGAVYVPETGRLHVLLWSAASQALQSFFLKLTEACFCQDVPRSP